MRTTLVSPIHTIVFPTANGRRPPVGSADCKNPNNIFTIRRAHYEYGFGPRAAVRDCSFCRFFPGIFFFYLFIFATIFFFFFLNPSWHTHTCSPIVKADTTARRYSVVGAEKWTRRRIKKKTYWQPISVQLARRPMTCRTTDLATGSFRIRQSSIIPDFRGAFHANRPESFETPDWFVRPTRRRRRVLDFIPEAARTSRNQTLKTHSPRRHSFEYNSQVRFYCTNK